MTILSHVMTQNWVIFIRWRQYFYSYLISARDGFSYCLKFPNLFVFQLSVFGSEGRVDLEPRLLHSANSSQLEVWLNGLPPRSNMSRFMLELEAVGGAYPLSKVDVRKFIDDEYTPSIFQVTKLYFKVLCLDYLILYIFYHFIQR